MDTRVDLRTEFFGDVPHQYVTLTFALKEIDRLHKVIKGLKEELHKAREQRLPY